MGRAKTAWMNPRSQPDERNAVPMALINKLGRWTVLDAETRALLEDLPGTPLSLDRGDVPQDAEGRRTIVLILEGWAALYKDMPNGRRVVLEFLLPGDFSRPHAGLQKSSGVMLLGPGRVLLIPVDAWAAMAFPPPIQRAFAWIERVRESICREWLVNIASRKAYGRLAHLLCELSVRSNTVGMLDEDACELPLTQMDLADALAMTNVHLNMALQKLRNAGVVEIGAKRLRILDRAGLEAIAGFDDDYLLRWPTELPDRRLRPATPLSRQERRSRLLKRR